MAGATAIGASVASLAWWPSRSFVRPVASFAEEVRGRGGNRDEIGPAGELDVTHRGLRRRIPQIIADGAAREGSERRGRDELGRRLSRGGLDFGATISRPAHEVRALVGGDTARDA